MTLETERLIIRPITKNDGAFVLELLNTEGWITHVGDRAVHTVDAAVKYIEDRMLPQYKKYGYGNFVIEDKLTAEKLGTVGLYRREGMEGVDLGFATLPKNYCKGYTYEGAAKLLKHALETLKLPLIQAITTEENIASQKLIDKLGFTFVELKEISSMNEKMMYYRY